MTAIQTNGLTKRFKNHVAVDEIDLTVPSGSIYGLVGPNGAGKSTLLELLSGFRSPTAGSATVLGMDPVTERSQLHLGILFTQRTMYRRLSALEHVRSAIALHDSQLDAVELCDRVGLRADTVSRRVGSFSTGQLQRTKLAIALAGSPPLLLLDEPTAGLDPDGVKRFERIVHAERDRGATVVLSSHRVHLLESLCTHVAVVRDGTITSSGPIDSMESFAHAVEPAPAPVYSPSGGAE